MRLLVIDGNSIANRAFFGIKLLTTKDGRYTNAIYGFLNILLSLLKECEPDEVAVAFDLKAPTFRHKMYDGYKATRHGMPEELAQQMPVLKELLADLGYRTVTAEGWEADDILGTLAAACAARKDDCFLATGDRDSLQLVSDTTTVLLAATVMGRSKTVTMDVDAIQEKYGIQPRQLIEVKSLMGDASDNIPGVKGIGEKTALTLVQNFGTLEGVYEHIDDKLIKPKQREHLLECREMAQLSHTLGTIRTDAPIDTAEGTYAVGEGNKAEAVRLLQELEIHSLIPRFGLDGIAPAAPEEEDGIELAEAGLEALPLTPSGTYLVASRPAVMGKQGTRNVVLQPESWYAVQDCTVYPLEDDDLMRLLDNADVTLEVFNAAPLYAKAMAAGGWGSSIVWDGKLAAYLLDASASKYQISELTASYRAAAAFTCADYPDAGRLADLFCKMKAEITACGEDSLYNEIEFPLAQVLADMTRTGVLVDKDGIEQFGVKLRTELGSQLRAYFIAKPGCVLVDADYSQIELRILAHITGDEHMQQAFLNGEDIHRSTAAKIYGIPQEEVTSRLRSSAKAINFGIMYGKGAYSLAKDIGVSVKEADAFLKNYLAAFPKVSGYMDKTIADAKAVGYVSTLFGRRRALPELASSNFNVRSSGERMARNTPIQGTAADVIKLAMVRVWKRLRNEKMESRLILTVHDELIVEAPQAEAEKAAQILREEMEGCVQYAVPLSTDVHAGKNWLEAH